MPLRPLRVALHNRTTNRTPKCMTTPVPTRFSDEELSLIEEDDADFGYPIEAAARIAVATVTAAERRTER